MDSVSLNLDDVEIVLGGLRDWSAWQKYVKKLKPTYVDDAVQIKEQPIKCNICGSENSSEIYFALVAVKA